MQGANNLDVNDNVNVNFNVNQERSASTDSTWTLTPPQSRIPLSSSASSMTVPKELFKNPILPKHSYRAPISANMVCFVFTFIVLQISLNLFLGDHGD